MYFSFSCKSGCFGVCLLTLPKSVPAPYSVKEPVSFFEIVRVSKQTPKHPLLQLKEKYIHTRLLSLLRFSASRHAYLSRARFQPCCLLEVGRRTSNVKITKPGPKYHVCCTYYRFDFLLLQITNLQN
jgi:hypothetical protein